MAQILKLTSLCKENFYRDSRVFKMYPNLFLIIVRKKKFTGIVPEIAQKMCKLFIFALFSEKLGHQEKLSATAGHGGRHKSNV